jgi:hypothetical protein
MGYSSWNPSSYDSYSSTIRSKSTAEVFASRNMDRYLDPLKFKNRESRDSTANPLSTPIILASDVTGSMGRLATQIIKNDLGTIMGEIYDRKPVTDPHILVAAVGDTYYDSSPFQATQFEADISIAAQMEKFYIEGGGGGNSGESYIAAWYFAAFRTETDSFAKRGKKGYLFTIGDEAPLLTLPASHIKKFFDDTVQADMDAKNLLDIVRQSWNVFHIQVAPHGSWTHDPQRWRDVIGQNLILLEDSSKLGEIIVSTIQIVEGSDHKTVASSWSGDTSIVVAKATKDVVRGTSESDALVTL